MMDKSQKIFVAGQSGFVGSALVRALQNKGYNNLILPNRQQLDLLDSSAVEHFFKNNSIDYVFVCAGKVGGIKANYTFPADFMQQNLSIYNNIIQAAARYEVKKLLYLGSSCMYSPQSSLPFKESDLFSGPLESTNHSFAVAKLAGYELCRAISKQHSKSFVTAIPTGLFGVGDHFNSESAHVIPSLMYRLWHAQKNKDKKIEVWGSGNQKREFLFVEDCAEALIKVMTHYHEPEAINIGMGNIVTIKELVEVIKEISGFSGEVIFDKEQPDGMAQKYLSAEKIKSLGWQPKTSLKQGLQITWDWALKNVFKS